MTGSSALEIDVPSTALVLVDLQQLTVALPTQPIPGRTVLANAVKLAHACRSAGMLTVLLRVDGGHGGALDLKPPADVLMPSFEFPPGSFDFPAELGLEAGDVIVTKYNWGAFYCTDLEVQLRRRSIKTLIVGGIATNYGVESTMRQAHERGYAQIMVSDATAAFQLEEHEFPLRTVLPRIARIRTTADILQALAGLNCY